MSDIVEAEGVVPKERFPARDRDGVVLGLSALQLGVGGGAIGLVILLMLLGVEPVVAGVGFIAVLPVVVLALWTYRGEALLHILARSGAALLRQASGQHRFLRNVWRVLPSAVRPAGNGQHAAFVVDHAPLPGGLGDVRIVQVPGAGAFAHNAAAGEVSVTATVRSVAWKLRDSSDKYAAYNGLVDWFSGLEAVAGLTEMTCRVRVDRASSTALADYIAARDAERVAGGLFKVTPALEREYQELIGIGAQRAMSFTNTVTLSFSTRELARVVKVSGGGLTGLGVVLRDRIEQLQQACDGAQVTFGKWLDADELIDAIWTSYDPVGAGQRRERLGDDHPGLPVMAAETRWDHFRADASLHRTYWIAEWPRTEQKIGFLEPLLYNGQGARTLTLQVRPVPIEKAYKQLNSQQASKEVAEIVKFKLNARTTAREQRAKRDLDAREEDLADGFGDVRIRGFVTVTAEDEDALARGQADIEQAQHKARVKIVALRGQQAEAFTSAVLPVPTGKK